jgi:hypothetical protein
MERMNALAKSKEDLDIILSKLKELSYFNQFIERNLGGSKKDVLLQVVIIVEIVSSVLACVWSIFMAEISFFRKVTSQTTNSTSSLVANACYSERRAWNSSRKVKNLPRPSVPIPKWIRAAETLAN